MELNVARKEFENTVKSYLEQMAQNDPNLLSRIVNTHARAIKSMAVWDDTLFALLLLKASVSDKCDDQLSQKNRCDRKVYMLHH